MFLQQHKSRILAALVLFAAFTAIGSAALTVDSKNNRPVDSITPDSLLSSAECEVRVTKAATYASQSVALDLGEAIPAITVEETVLISPTDDPPAAQNSSESEPYLTYYEAGHFAAGENGTLTAADGSELCYSAVIPVSATAYTTERQENKITATGTVAHVGGIAVDPSVIPYGTQLYIVSEAGSWAYGYAVAEDCGGGIKGNKIDLFFDTYNECIQFGVRNALVYILEN